MANQNGDNVSQGKNENFNGTYNKVVNTILVLLESSLCLFIGMLPLLLVVFAVRDLTYWPTYLLAAWLSMPGLTALFAMFRDQPMLFSINAETRARVWREQSGAKDFPPDWIAEPYVPFDRTVAFIGPYFKAYAKLFVRSITISFVFLLLVFCFIYDVFIMMQTSWGAFVVPILIVCCALFVQAMLVALVLTVEYPKAKFFSRIRNGFMLAVRRIPAIIISMVALVGYGWGMTTKYGLLVLVLTTGIVAYLVWSSANWQANLMFVAMAKESGDKRIIDMYSVVNKTSGGSFFSGTRDYQS
ncbi:hypothetical protein [Bifidobacterium oedipodis]|uniref:Uncharacterized protein n=1 Tax=Bifidobacterium oedipodis TaxID=2675322 RepID=A0A7Y0EQX0_9BIFI|nr:hypothetical protein [Bifidobacterium sp. DSM 109957]NMM93686.1 hypothetical protein [Bifidobacterium sp. DSM 109957]